MSHYECAYKIVDNGIALVVNCQHRIALWIYREMFDVMSTLKL